MLTEYAKEVADASWEFAKGGGEVIEIIIWVVVFFAPKILAKHEAKAESELESAKSIRKIFIAKFLNKEKWRAVVVLMAFFIFHCLIIAPYHVYKKTKEDNEHLSDRAEKAEVALRDSRQAKIDREKEEEKNPVMK